MMEKNFIEFSQLVKKSFDSLTLKTVTFSSPITGETEKIRFEIRKVGANNVLQGEYKLSEGRVKQRNLKSDEIEKCICEELENFKRAELYDAGGTVSLMKSKKGKVSIVRHGSIGKGEIVKPKENNREKKYILSGNEEFLRHLGVSDASGRVYDKKQSKFRQINRFLENLRDVLKYLPTDGEIRVADLCCGKSYLSFAVYHYLTVMKGRSVKMLGIDLKRDVIEFCNEKAKELGFFGMQFVTDDITNTPKDVAPDMVISLHACDVATDIVLDTAARLGAKVILSTPCCHRELSTKIDAPVLSFVTKYPKLKRSLCDSLTDALRLERLSYLGYDVNATELVDPEDTPKNTLIRAVKRRAASKDTSAYTELLRFLLGEGADDYIGKL